MEEIRFETVHERTFCNLDRDKYHYVSVKEVDLILYENEGEIFKIFKYKYDNIIFIKTHAIF